MRFIHKQVTVNCDYPLIKIDPSQKIIFFDIETTGLSANDSTFYLIGCLYPENDIWYLHQWFSENMADEPKILQNFFVFIQQFHVMIHFNGERFDIPYLTHCAAQYGVEETFHNLIQIDLLKKIRPYKQILGLDSLKQTSLESFLHIDRKDRYNGAELIPVYEQYRQSKDLQLLHLLLLHNEDDLKGMPQLLPLLYYELFFKENTKFSNCSYYFTNKNQILLQGYCTFCLPNSLYLETDLGVCQMQRNLLTFELTLFEGELKYFYPDYKNYYYLPTEDMAIHQKIAQFVDKDHKKKATAATAYTRKSGHFLPLGTNWRKWEKDKPFADIAVFREELKGKQAWILLDDQEETLQLYLQFLISRFK
ncbi:MAG: ribonuclease H-like domain-containing protein [Lachnospiraceae bacterium]